MSGKKGWSGRPGAWRGQRTHMWKAIVHLLSRVYSVLKIVRSSKRGTRGSELSITKISLVAVWKRDCSGARGREETIRTLLAVIQSFGDLCSNTSARKQTDSRVVQKVDPTNVGTDWMCSWGRPRRPVIWSKQVGGYGRINWDRPSRRSSMFGGKRIRRENSSVCSAKSLWVGAEGRQISAREKELRFCYLQTEGAALTNPVHPCQRDAQGEHGWPSSKEWGGKHPRRAG